MKRLTIIFFFFIIGYALYWCISDYDYRYNKINSIVGIYKLDFNHTDSEIYKDSIEKYNNLRLIFNSNMTFSLSFSVPFMADTVGTWKVGGMDEWNEIVYHNGIIDQLGEFDDGDTIIYDYIYKFPNSAKNLQETDTNRQGFLCENKVIF